MSATDTPPPGAAVGAIDVFISYAGPDKPHARALRDALRARGLRAFVDEADLLPGDDWYTGIPTALGVARMVVVLVGPGWKDGQTWYAPEEVILAISHCRARRGLRVVPLRMRHAADAPAPYGLGRLVGINDADDDWSDTAGRLVQALGGRVELGGDLGSRPAVVFTRDLPLGGEHFFGRETELAALRKAWSNRKPRVFVVAVSALGGTGKSALVRRWLNEMQAADWDGAERVYCWSFAAQGGDAEGSSGLFVDEMTRWLGAETSPETDPDKKADRLARAIRRQRTLLVLDGIEPMQHPKGTERGKIKDPLLAALLRALADGFDGLCVVTSRVELTDLRDRGHAVLHHALVTLSDGAGVSLLRALGVRGREASLAKAVAAYRGHAMALNLLGTWLANAWGGNVRRRDKLPRLEAVDGGEPLERVMLAYERWFESGRPRNWWQRLWFRFRPPPPGPEVAILRLMGFFDRPAEPDEIEALRGGVTVRGLTDAFAELGPAQWGRAVADLRALGLLAPASTPAREGQTGTRDAAEPDAADDEVAERAEAAAARLDAHPLVREHFGARVRREAPTAWTAGHERLYRHFAATAEFRPATLAGMEPLFRAVQHGCAAGRYQEVLDAVYWRRIQRGGEFYARKRLGAFAADLAALAGFFAAPWQEPQPTMSEAGQAAVLGWAASGLRALGRLAEAVGPTEAGLAYYVRQAAWKNAAGDAGNLAELLLTLGRLGETPAAAPGAVERAREAVAHADRSGDGLQRMSKRTALADALHQRGHSAAARDLFVEAERLQAERQPALPLLYSLRGYRYGDLLLALGEPAEARRRAEKMLNWLQPSDSLLTIALGHLLLGRAALVAALDPDHPDFTLARRHLDAAVIGLRKAGTQEFIAVGLLHRAALHRRAADWPAARRDLDEAHRIAARGGMRLYLADHLLESARLHLATGERDAARAAYTTARAEVAAMGYHRRDPELAELAAALGEPAPAPAPG